MGSFINSESPADIARRASVEFQWEIQLNSKQSKGETRTVALRPSHRPNNKAKSHRGDPAQVVWMSRGEIDSAWGSEADIQWHQAGDLLEAAGQDPRQEITNPTKALRDAVTRAASQRARGTAPTAMKQNPGAQQTGELKRWMGTYGFLHSKTGDLFTHITDFPKSHTPTVGRKYSFATCNVARGEQATECTPAEGPPPAGDNCLRGGGVG